MLHVQNFYNISLINNYANTYKSNQYCWKDNCKQFPQHIPAQLNWNFDFIIFVRLKFHQVNLVLLYCFWPNISQIFCNKFYYLSCISFIVKYNLTILTIKGVMFKLKWAKRFHNNIFVKDQVSENKNGQLFAIMILLSFQTFV